MVGKRVSFHQWKSFGNGEYAKLCSHWNWKHTAGSFLFYARLRSTCIMYWPITFSFTSLNNYFVQRKHSHTHRHQQVCFWSDVSTIIPRFSSKDLKGNLRSDSFIQLWSSPACVNRGVKAASAWSGVYTKMWFLWSFPVWSFLWRDAFQIILFSKSTQRKDLDVKTSLPTCNRQAGHRQCMACWRKIEWSDRTPAAKSWKPEAWNTILGAAAQS